MMGQAGGLSTCGRGLYLHFHQTRYIFSSNCPTGPVLVGFVRDRMEMNSGVQTGVDLPTSTGGRHCVLRGTYLNLARC